MQRLTKAIAAIMLMITVMFAGGCGKPENETNENRETIGDWVDLGLPSGLLWATRNVGATFPEDYGVYFSWGETQPKDDYGYLTYKFITYCPDNIMGGWGPYRLTKYCSMSFYGYNDYTDMLTLLLPSDDAATVNWGDGARTPTIGEWDELLQNTTSQWTTYYGVKGRLFTGKNGNSLFLPCAGYAGNNGYNGFIGSAGYYWSSSLYISAPAIAWSFYFNSEELQESDNMTRERGLPVRAVRYTR